MREIKSEKYLGDVLFMGFKTYGRRNVCTIKEINSYHFMWQTKDILDYLLNT